MAKKEIKTPVSEKNPALEAALAQIQKTFGKEAIMKMGDGSQQNIEAISSGSVGLDIALGIGGYPKGRIVEIFGPESSGKTTLALHAVAESQKKGGTCVYIDAENALDPSYAKKLGVNVENLIISQPDSGEQALDIADTLIKSGAVDVVVVDSVAALVPKAELEGNIGDAQMGGIARIMGQACRIITPKASSTGTVVIWINQIREKIGVMFGNPETTTGGNAMKFFASIRLEISKKAGTDKNDKGEPINNIVKVKSAKNKTTPPNKICEFDILYGEGIDKVSEILVHGVETGIINKSGSWYNYGDVKLGQGGQGVKALLRDNPELTEELEIKIKDKMKKYDSKDQDEDSE